jgi:hypothetical protein
MDARSTAWAIRRAFGFGDYAFGFSINLKAAKVLRLTVPHALLARADELID